jgi:hypothetical protein
MRLPIRQEGQASRMDVTWFRHDDEHRNELLRYGLMRLAKERRITYREAPRSEASEAGFSSIFASASLHHISILAIALEGKTIQCLVDGEDSFYWLSPLIAEVDLYFCSGFNAQFFRGFEFPRPNAWQSDEQISYYRSRAKELIEEHRIHFSKVRPFVPIGPSLSAAEEAGGAVRKIRNARHKFGSFISDDLYWQLDYEAYSRRYARLLSLRHAPLKYDVVLNDSLWGWPMRRIGLHEELRSLKHKFAIHAKLSWAPPARFDGSDRLGLCSSDFPRVIGQINDYERMLASSRLGVFATGFHWGWRSIMTLAMLFGIPVLTDRLLLQPWFKLDQFDLAFNDGKDWSCVASALAEISAETWRERRERNARVYDIFMAPEAVANYVLDTTKEVMSERIGGN